MAKSNRTRRTAAGETGENSGTENQTARNERTEVQGGNLNNAQAAAAATAAAQTAVNPPVGLEVVLDTLAQVLARLPPVVPVAPEPVERRNVADEPRQDVPRNPTYLKVMDHMQKLGTKFFSGVGSKPIEADQWINRLVRNFDSIRCLESYRRDIAVHYLEGDAHTWWQGVATRLGAGNVTWAMFSEEFTSKYFPPEAFDKLEGQFLELHQGTMTVREYEAEFSRLKRYAGHELDAERVQVRRFMRGLRVDIRNRCQIRNYDTMSELVEKAAQQEAGLVDELKVLGKGLHVQAKNVVGRNPTAAASKPADIRPTCKTCGKFHSGVCRTGTGACLRCGRMDHQVRDCLEPVGAGSGVRTCYGCGETGHFRSECPKIGQGVAKRTGEGPQPPAKRPAVLGRVYSVGDETLDPSSSRPITGTPKPE